MNDEFFDEIEFDDEVTDETIVSDALYISLGNPKLIGDKGIPLAFTVSDNVKPVTFEGVTLAWASSALEALGEIQKATCKEDSAGKNLPYTSLLSLLEIGLDRVVRIQNNVGLSRFALNRDSSEPSDVFAYLNSTDITDTQKILRPILNDWMTNFLNPFAEKEGELREAIDRLESLYEQNKLLTIEPLSCRVLPWKWNQSTGTTRGSSQYDFCVLVDHVARAIAGKEIFQGLGSMKRALSGGGNFRTGKAELMTDPITLPDYTGKFSLVINLEVVTYPSIHQPLIKIDVSKRRWFSKLKSAHSKAADISGFVFSEDYRDRAFRYKVVCRPEKQKKTGKDKKKSWFWAIDNDFEALRRKLKLPIKTPDGQSIDGSQIALGKASTERCQVMLTYSNGVQEGNHEIDAGVPEIDKLEAFDKISAILQTTGFEPFDRYSTVKIKGESHKVDKTVSRTINFPTLLGAALESLENSDCSHFTPRFVANLEGEKLNNLLSKHFSIELENIGGNKAALKMNSSKSLDQSSELQTLIRENQEAMHRMYPNEKLLLVIFHEDYFQAELELLKAIIQVLWGGTIEMMTNSLPANTHGPKESLPGANLKAKERSRRRIAAWESLVQDLALRKQRTFCLVMAREWYPNNKHDDRVNKPSSRQALTKISDCCVQFLLPIETTLKEPKRLKLDNFFHRVQAALKDLLFAHSGRIDKVKEKVDRWLKDIPQEARPKEIIGITIVRKQKGRVRGFIDNTFLPVAMRIEVETGECELCCAYEKANRLQVAPWSKFVDSIAFISQLSPIKLANHRETRKTYFMDFVKQVISTSVEAGNQPLVMIDSSNCVQLWPWLADIRINANQINLGQQYERMQDEWKGARLIRIRQDLAPGIIERKVRELAETCLDDTRKKEELTPTIKIPSASSAMKLFKLTSPHPNSDEASDTGCVAYLSVGRKTLQQKSRGQSCYRETQIPKKVKKENKPSETVLNQAGLKVHQIINCPPFVGQYPTPNPLEIVVTLRQENDDPDRLAALVESLRYDFGHYGDWSSLPAPLFFERVVRDYISEFAFAEEEDETK